MYRCGIDIGTTTIRFVLLKNNQLLRKKKISTPKTKDELLTVLKKNIRSLIKGFKVAGIGIGVPGPLNKKGDLILNPPNLTYLKNCPLAKIIERSFKIKTKMENDANCFTLGEAVLGAGQGYKIVFGITLGSGVGGGIVINNKIYRGAFGAAGEAGHMTIKFDGQKCSCGSYGCLEVYCRGNKTLKIYDGYGKNLGIGLSNVINLLDPEVIVIGGGVANVYHSFIKETEKEIGKRVVSPFAKKYVKIRKAKLGDLAGAIGAALII